MTDAVIPPASHRARGQSQLRQDRAVQPPDRQPTEGGQLRWRHRRAEGGGRSPRPSRALEVLDLPGTYSLRARCPDEAITRDVVLGRQCRPSAARPDRLRRRRHQPAPRPAPGAGAEAGPAPVLALNMIDIARGMVSHRLDGLRWPWACRWSRRSPPAGAALTCWSLLVQIAAAPSAASGRTLARAASRRNPAPTARPSGLKATTGRRRGSIPSPAGWTAPLHPAPDPLLLPRPPLDVPGGVAWACPPWRGRLVPTALVAALAQATPDSLFRSPLPTGSSPRRHGDRFLPLILIVFFFIILLEDFGYMARAAFLMDRIIWVPPPSRPPPVPPSPARTPGIMSTRVIDTPARTG